MSAVLNSDLTQNALETNQLNEKMENLKARYSEQFGAMEAAVASLKSTETAITNMMEAWKGSMNR